MRKKKVCTLEAANGYLEQEYLPLWNERFTVPPASAVDAHRPLGKSYNLASILSHVEQRVVGQDYTIRYDGRRYQVVREQIRPGLRGQRVRVEQRLDGSVAVHGPSGPLGVKLCEGAVRPVAPEQREARPAKPAQAAKAGHHHSKGNRRWMYGFDLDSGPSLETSHRARLRRALGRIRTAVVERPEQPISLRHTGARRGDQREPGGEGRAGKGSRCISRAARASVRCK